MKKEVNKILVYWFYAFLQEMHIVYVIECSLQTDCLQTAQVYKFYVVYSSDLPTTVINPQLPTGTRATLELFLTSQGAF